MSCRSGMFVTVTRPPGWRWMNCRPSPDLFGLTVATSKVCAAGGGGSCATPVTTMKAAMTHDASKSFFMGRLTRGRHEWLTAADRVNISEVPGAGSTMSDERGLRNISDTARWVAIYRALESERPDALFHDPFARQLAGERGARITEGKAFANRNAWSFVTRTVLFDRFISDAVANGVDMVVNLAAGLDVRPYRMTLPSHLQWIEVDLPDLLAYKTEQLAREAPRCLLERVAVDLSDVAARRELFARLGARAKAAMVVSEGLVVYLASEEAVALAADLARTPAFNRWALDMVSPALMAMMQKSMGKDLREA